jgi:Tfp pilus assembly protein PilX
MRCASDSIRLKRLESGFVLLVALIALAAMSLAGIALMRAMTNDTAISGNLAFRQSTINTGDSVIDDGVQKVTWDLLQPDTSNGNNPTSWMNQGTYYSATMLPTESGTTAPGSSGVGFVKTNGIPIRLLPENTPVCTASGAGTYSYAIFDADTGNCASVFIDRLCTSAGAATTSSCILLSSLVSNNDQYAQGHGGDSGEITLPNNKVAVRVSVRIDGPRGTTTYLQAIVGQKLI